MPGAGACTLLLEWEALPGGEPLLGEGAQKWLYQCSCQLGLFILIKWTFVPEDSKDKLLCVFLEISWQTVYAFSHATGDQGHPSNRPYWYGSVGFLDSAFILADFSDSILQLSAILCWEDK